MPNEGFFILKNFLNENEIAALLLAALTQWCYLPSAKCNLGTTIKTNNLISCTDPFYMKLRWITLGYHYQWSERTYDPSKVGELPALLSETTLNCIHFLGHLLKTGNISAYNSSQLLDKCQNYKPEAAIINYYRTKTTMGFHSDDAEVDKEAPLVSISIGPTALFLLETSEPIQCQYVPIHAESINEQIDYNSILPIFLHHGDIIIMSGKSRLARHAVPVIFFNTIPEVVSKLAERVSYTICVNSFNQNHTKDTCIHCKECWKYIESTRINMNVRQVMPVHRDDFEVR
ncbi:unnamed protein product [Heterobilharzia americana]|nr:unnamed protein product [Heterobilharzia americana]